MKIPARHRLKSLKNSLLFSAFILHFFISLPILAGEFGVNKKPIILQKESQPTKAIDQTNSKPISAQDPQVLVGDFVADRPDYNDLPRPQFIMEQVGEETKIKNGGWGDGSESLFLQWF
jgi:hypothetical protein